MFIVEIFGYLSDFSYSRCVQLHSYTYALVKDTSVNRDKKSPTFPGSLDSGNNSYILDYIEVRSGCACVVVPPEKTKENKNLENKKSKKSHKPHKNKQNRKSHHRNKNVEIPLLPRDDDSTFWLVIVIIWRFLRVGVSFQFLFFYTKVSISLKQNFIVCICVYYTAFTHFLT